MNTNAFGQQAHTAEQIAAEVIDAQLRAWGAPIDRPDFTDKAAPKSTTVGTILAARVFEAIKGAQDVVKPASLFARESQVRHRKSGEAYEILMNPSDNLRLEKTDEPAYLYAKADRSNLDCGDTRLWVRGRSEMEDGRFELVEKTIRTPSGVSVGLAGDGNSDKVQENPADQVMLEVKKAWAARQERSATPPGVNLRALFRRKHASVFDPNSSLDREKMCELVARLNGRSHDLPDAVARAIDLADLVHAVYVTHTVEELLQAGEYMATVTPDAPAHVTWPFISTPPPPSAKPLTRLTLAVAFYRAAVARDLELRGIDRLQELLDDLVRLVVTPEKVAPISEEHRPPRDSSVKDAVQALILALRARGVTFGGMTLRGRFHL